MEIFFHDPEDIPLPPDQVKIREFRARPYPDGRRVRVYLEITPFQKRPSGEISLLDPVGRVLATVSIIETIDPRMEMTMHLRGEPPEGPLTADVELFYEDLPEGEENGEEPVYSPPERTVIDRRTVEFQI